MEKHEVVVVGAGPAGLKAAELLGKAGKDVLVIEGLPENKIGDKPCGGILFPAGMSLVPEMIPESLVEKRFTKAKVSLPNRSIEFSLSKPFGVCDRLELGQYQLKKAKEAGALVKLGVFNKIFIRMIDYERCE